MKPIDILSKHLNVSNELDIEINEPYMVFKVNIECAYCPFLAAVNNPFQ
uniref:Uncharacterized protein n=1 Tax=Rhizophora mucronata TaxID=61149 RepID=A0A2P2K944_RHIMU